jgi:hypothetical protein
MPASRARSNKGQYPRGILKEINKEKPEVSRKTDLEHCCIEEMMACSPLLFRRRIAAMEGVPK